MTRPHVVFIISLVLVGPVIAIAAVAAGGLWVPAGVGSAAGLVSLAAWASFVSLRRSPLGGSVLRARMMGVTASTSIAAGLLTVGSAVWLVLDAVFA